jgi:S-sulfosulfanyl-L-cysteine sulfohydrolase
MNRREFVQLLAIASASGMNLHAPSALANSEGTALYDLPEFGNVNLLHYTDAHAQLLPVWFREPSFNLGLGDWRGKPPHLTGQHLLDHYGIAAGTRQAHALSCLDFESAARTYGKVGGYAHLATLVKRMRESRPGALLLDGGDTWQGSATALWTRGADMLAAQLELGVDVMTGHWEFTYGMARLQELVNGPMKDRIEFLAHNVRTNDFGDPVFPPYTLRDMNGVTVAVIGQAFPYTPIANPRHFVADWSFGIQEEQVQSLVDEVRGKGAQVVVLLSHNGMDVDLKLASRVRGLDAILGGHTHDGIPRPVPVKNAAGVTLVTNAGSNGKFLGVLDFDVRGGAIKDWHYRLLPVFANLLPADPGMQKVIDAEREPYLDKLGEELGVSEGLLYRRGNFNGSFDQVILDALMSVQDAQIAFSPGFRWGTSLLPGETLTMERLMDQTAITYPAVTVNEFSGARIKAILEDVADNLFNPDPYYQQGGDMVRVGGLTYSCTPGATSGERISDLRLGESPIDAAKNYKVAGWASVAENAEGPPVWDVVATYLRAHSHLPAPTLNLPTLHGVEGNPGIV